MNPLRPIAPPVRRSQNMIQNEMIIKFILDSMSYSGFWEDLNRIPVSDALPMTTPNCPLDELHRRTSQQPLLNEPITGFGRTCQGIQVRKFIQPQHWKNHMSK